MTLLRKLEIGVFLAALVLGSLFLRGWIAERAARNSAEAFAKAQNTKAEDLSRQISASKSEDAGYRSGLARAAASVTTPQQAVKIITRYLPAVGDGQKQIPFGNDKQKGDKQKGDKQSIPVVSANELDAEVRAQLPAAPNYAILTPAQTEAIAKDELSCDADRHSLAACSVQLADAQQIAALDKAEAAKYKQAMLGGTIFQRVGKVLKFAACAGGGAMIGAVVTRGSQSQVPATAAGAATGVIACSIF